jgi:predicted dehydrogenase
MVDAVARAPVRATRVLGESGTLEWSAAAGLLRHYDAATQVWADYREPVADVEAGYSDMSNEAMYVDETNAFVRACRGEAPYPHSFSEDRRILQTLLAAESAAESRLHVIEG